MASSFPVQGRHLFQAMRQMRNRGNGKGGGIAAVGLSPDQLGVTSEILESDYLIQIAYLDPSVREEVERRFLKGSFTIDECYPVASLPDYREAEGIEVSPPLVWRYFCRVREEGVEKFIREHSLHSLERSQAEDELVYQCSYLLNRTYYTSLGEKKAFVLSHGKNMLVLKIVGYAEQVVQYYRLEDLTAHVWIGHQRYPTKGRVWHPGGAHPFVGLHEALVHNGDFANYHSICEYLAQRNIAPLFLTDTEVSVLLFDLWSRVYGYPLEYLIEAMAPTTERDFEMLPEEKKRIYRAVQAAHIHGSPDGPWFFIIARNHLPTRSFQLIGITDTSMLRPQVFALHEGKLQIGMIGSERQAIDAALESLWRENREICPFADLYWNARGGSHTDGGAFVFSVSPSPPADSGSLPLSPGSAAAASEGQPSASIMSLNCADKFGKDVSVPQERSQPLPEISVSYEGGKSHRSLPEAIAKGVASRLDSQKKLLESIRSEQDLRQILENATRQMNMAYPSCLAVRKWEYFYAERAIEEILRSIPLLGASSSAGQRDSRPANHEASGPLGSPGNRFHLHFRVTWETRRTVVPPAAAASKPQDGATTEPPSHEEEPTLVLDATGFPQEGEESVARCLVAFYQAGWRKFIVFACRGHRFIGCGLGPGTIGVTIHVYGRAGDYLGSGLDGGEIHLHGTGQDQLAQIIKAGKLVIYGDVGQTFMYGAKGGEIYVKGNAAGRPLINAVGSPKAIINGTCLDYLAESFMAGDPLNGGGFVILNGVTFGPGGQILDLELPYPGGNLLSLASGGAAYIRDPLQKVGEDQLNGGRIVPLTEQDWGLISPYLKENEKLFGIPLERLLQAGGKSLTPYELYRKVEPVRGRELDPSGP